VICGKCKCKGKCKGKAKKVKNKMKKKDTYNKHQEARERMRTSVMLKKKRIKQI
jgi:hypothetical protein